MTIMLAIHIAGGIVALLAGFSALLSRKGSPFDRAAGYLFVGSMIVMALGAAVVAAPEAGIRPSDRVLSAPDAHVDLTMKGIP